MIKTTVKSDFLEKLTSHLQKYCKETSPDSVELSGFVVWLYAQEGIHIEFDDALDLVENNEGNLSDPTSDKTR